MYNEVEETGEATIVQAHVDEITPAMKNGDYDGAVKVMVAFSDNVEAKLFEFYPDEILFTKDEFIGLTREQALRHKEKRYREINL